MGLLLIICLCSPLHALLSSFAPRAVINPTELRVALAEHTPFKCQEMNDANELLDTIYECFKESQVGVRMSVFSCPKVISPLNAVPALPECSCVRLEVASAPGS